jgi:hypothetical protein
MKYIWLATDAETEEGRIGWESEEEVENYCLVGL